MNPYVIALAHQKGGVGKSTLASSMVLELEKKGTVTVIDLDERQRSISYFLEKKPESHNIKYIIVSDREKLVSAYENVNTDYIVIDCGGVDSDVNRIALVLADLVIVPVKPNDIELAGLIVFEENIHKIEKEFEDKIENIYIVANRVHPRKKDNAPEILGIDEYIQSSNTYKRFSTIIHNRVEYENAFNEGRIAKHEEFKSLIKEIYNVRR